MAKSKGKGKQHGTRGKKGFHERGTKTNKKHKLVKNTQSRRTRVGITLTTGLTQGDRNTDLWADPAWEQAARQLPSTQPAQEQSNPTHGGSISMFGGLTMCELSVNDGEQQSEQNQADRNLCDDGNDKIGNWVHNVMMNGHKNSNTIWHRNWIQNKMTGCHAIWDKHWNNRSWYRSWIHEKLTGGHNIWSSNWRTDRVRNKSSRSVESVGQTVGVSSDRRCRQITFGIDTAACRTVVLARHPATRGYRCHWDAEAGAQYSTV